MKYLFIGISLFFAITNLWLGLQIENEVRLFNMFVSGFCTFATIDLIFNLLTKKTNED